MLSLTLSMAMLTSTGGLLSDHLPAGVRLLDAAEVVPSAMLTRIRRREQEEDFMMGIQSMSLQQLHEEYDRLEDMKPSIALGLTFTIIGGALLITDMILWTAFYWYGAAVLIPLTVLAGAVVFCIIGPILLARAARERHRIGRDQNLIERRIRSLERGPPLPPSVPQDIPPPPPPPPPLGGLGTVEPHLVLAEF